MTFRVGYSTLILPTATVRIGTTRSAQHIFYLKLIHLICIYYKNDSTIFLMLVFNQFDTLVRDILLFKFKLENDQ